LGDVLDQLSLVHEKSPLKCQEMDHTNQGRACSAVSTETAP